MLTIEGVIHPSKNDQDDEGSHSLTVVRMKTPSVTISLALEIYVRAENLGSTVGSTTDNVMGVTPVHCQYLVLVSLQVVEGHIRTVDK